MYIMSCPCPPPFTTPCATILLSNGKWNKKLNIGIRQAKDMEQLDKIFLEEVSLFSCSCIFTRYMYSGRHAGTAWKLIKKSSENASKRN